MDATAWVRKMFGSDHEANLIAYQRQLVRTKDYERLGLAKKIVLGPSDNWKPPEFPDPYIMRFGRTIDLGKFKVPLAQSRDRSMLLVAGPFMHDRDYVGLPDVPDPNFVPPDWTPEEVQRKVPRDRRKDISPMLPQRLTDRCEQVEGHAAELPGTNFLVFQPVRRIAFVLRLGRGAPEYAQIDFVPDSRGRSATLLIDHRTGEGLFLFGTFQIFGARGSVGRDRVAETRAMQAGQSPYAA